jgi:hypothetical protein
MKKVLVFLLTLGFVANAFALDLGNGLTLNGEVKTGLRVATTADESEDTDDTTAGGYNDDADAQLRVRLTAGYEADWGGAKIRLQSLGGAQFVPRFAYGWANFLDKKIVVSGGLAIEDIWGLGKLSDNVFDPNVDEVNGVRVALNIVDGLSFGFALPVDQVTYYNRVTESSVAVNTKKDVTIGNLFGGVVIGALYKSDLVSAAAGVRLYPAIDSKAYGGSPDAKGDYATTESYANIIAGVEVNAVPGLKVIVDSRFDTRKKNFDDTYVVSPEKIGYSRIGLKGQYEIGKLTPYLVGDVAIFNQKSEEKDGNYFIDKETNGVASDDDYNYKDSGAGNTDVPGGLSFKLEIGAEYALTEKLTAYLGLGSDNVAWLAGDVDLEADTPVNRPGNGIFAKPGLKIAIGGGSIEIFDKINGIAAVDKQYTDPITSKVKSYSSVTNQLQIDFNWSF